VGIIESMSLYALEGRFWELQERAQDEDLSQELIAEQFEELSEMILQKTPGLVAWDRNLTLSISTLEAEISRLTAMKERIVRNQEHYREIVKNRLEAMQISKLETPLGKITIQKCPTSIEVHDLHEIPKELKRATITIKGTAAELEAAMNQIGIEINQGQLLHNGTTVLHNTEYKTEPMKDAIRRKLDESGEIVPGTMPVTNKTKIYFK
jgi:hypothetical protein